MTAYFQLARQSIVDDHEEAPSIFEESRPHKTENIIPPVGLAKPELVDAFLENPQDEENIRQAIYDTESYEKESLPQTAFRQVSSHAARLTEGFFGGIGGILNLLTPELWESEEGIPYGPGEGPEGFPSPSKLHEFTKEKTGQYLEPKGEASKASQEIASDIGSLLSFPAMGVYKSIFLPIGGQVVKQAIKASGGKESTQELGKLGFMTVASIANLGNAHKVASNALSQAETMIPKGLSFTAKPTEAALERIKQSKWYTTGTTPSKSPAMAEIDRIEAQIRNGKIDAHSAMQLRRDINEARKQLGGFQLNKPVNKRQALRYLDEVDSALLDSMEHYGKNVNPMWLKAYQQANQAFKVTERSRQLSDFIQQNARPLKSETAKILYHVGVASALPYVPVAIAAGVPVLAGAKGIQIINRMIRSPVLRNHYVDVLKQASLGNAQAMNASLQRFDEEAEKVESKSNNRPLPRQTPP